MKVLVACEFSGRVRDAFLEQGHDALSVDLLPTLRPGPHHQGDVRDLLDQEWDLMIAHPPCTYLCNASLRWLHQQPDRWQHMEHACNFFTTLLNAPIPHIAVENPVINPYARTLIGRGPDQIVKPWMFGHTETKRIGLWLTNLPPLIASNDVHTQTNAIHESKRYRHTNIPNGKNRWARRSLTLPGFATAMAEQWSGALTP